MSIVPHQPATIATVARLAGVSITTVSFALNGRAARHGISEETAERVLRAAREVNYIPNSLARSLRRRSTKAIGVVFPHLRNDWAHHLMEGMYELLDAESYVPYIVSHRGQPDQARSELASLAERRVDGILCNPLVENVNDYRQVMERGIPLVFFGDTLDELPEVSFAAWDPAEVGISVRHLIAVGCRRIAYLGFADNRRMTRARHEAFERALRDAGLEVRRDWIVLNQPGQSFDRALRTIFGQPEPPDALFALYDDTAMDALDALSAMGPEVAARVRVATLGNSQLIGPRGYNVTTTVAPVQREGHEAAKALLALIENPDAGPIHTLVSGGELIVRETTRPSFTSTRTSRPRDARVAVASTSPNYVDRSTPRSKA